MSDATPTTSPIVDERQPWLGLLPFREEHRRFFFGRDAEIAEILGRIRENGLTILFGQSGLGKTSLLGAAVLPALREAGFSPVLVRLDYTAGAPSLLEQTRAALRTVLPGAAWPEDAAAVPLWELFHRLPALLAPGAPVPVLLFDQFEEIFTLGAQDAAREREAALWLEQVADLLQNRPPRSLEERFAKDRRLAREYDFAAAPVRLVFALREDFLSHLEAWKTALPLLTQNRMALHLLNGPQALDAVLGPASLGAEPLVSREVAAAIVRTVARVPADTPLPRIRAVPPLLSLLCERLNAARLAAGAAQITAGMVREQSDDILQRFYTESLDPFPPEHREAIRALLEDPPMITEGGYRNSLVREDAEAHLTRLGIASPRTVFDTLIQRRLITAEERDRVQRLEITHDVLVPLLVRSRKERRERAALEQAAREKREADAREEEQRRQIRKARRTAAVFSILMLLSVIACVVAIRGYRSAKEAEKREKLQSVIAQDVRGMAVQAIDDITTNLLPLMSGAQTDSEKSLQSKTISIIEEALDRARNSGVDKELERLEAIALSFRVEYSIAQVFPGDSPPREIMERGDVQAAINDLTQELMKGPEKSWDRINDLTRKSQALFRAVSPELASATEKSRRAISLFEKLLPLFPSDVFLRIRYGAISRLYAKLLSDDEAEVLQYHNLAVRAFTEVSILDPAQEPGTLDVIAATHGIVADFYHNCDDAAKAAPFVKLAESAVEQLEADQPASSRWLGVVAQWHARRANQALLAKKYEEAKMRQEKVVSLRRKILGLDAYRSKLLLGKALETLATTQSIFLQQHDAATSNFNEAIRLLDDILRETPSDNEALSAMVGVLRGLSGAASQGDDVVTANWAAEQEVAYQRRLVATDPLNLENLGELHQSLENLKWKYEAGQDASKRFMASQLRVELLELAEKCLWLTRNTPVGPLLPIEKNPVRWLQQTMVDARWLRPSPSAVGSNTDLDQHWDRYLAASKAADEQFEVALTGQNIPPAFLTAANAAHDLAEAILNEPSGGRQIRQDTVARGLLNVCRYVFTQAGAQKEIDRKPLDSVEALSKLIPEPPYISPLMDQLLLERISNRTAKDPSEITKHISQRNDLAARRTQLEQSLPQSADERRQIEQEIRRLQAEDELLMSQQKGAETDLKNDIHRVFGGLGGGR